MTNSRIGNRLSSSVSLNVSESLYKLECVLSDYKMSEISCDIYFNVARPVENPLISTEEHTLKAIAEGLDCSLPTSYSRRLF